MSANRVIGGVLALIGSGLVLTGAILGMVGGYKPEIVIFNLYTLIFSLIIGSLGVIGGILALTGRSGLLALIIGIVMVITIMDVQLVANLGGYVSNFSLFAQYVYNIPYLTMEGILVLVGGIIAMPGSE